MSDQLSEQQVAASKSPSPEKGNKPKQEKSSSRRNKKKSKGKEASEGNTTESNSNTPDGNRNGNKKPKKPNGNKKSPDSKNKAETSEKKSSKGPKTKFSPKLAEIKRLTDKFKPITINGIPVSSLSKPYLEYIEDVMNDSSSTIDDAIYISFLLQPSDPDFPYDVSVLTISLCLPSSYPFKSPNPTITVLNDDIPKGFSVNIEIGFKQIVAKALQNRAERKRRKSGRDSNESPEKKGNNDEDEEEEIEMQGGNDLRAMFLTLDKYLERFLAMEKKKTIKFVRTIKKKAQEQEITAPQSVKQSKPVQQDTKVPPEIFAQREKEIRKFKQRLQDDNIVLFKDTPSSSIYRFQLSFQDDSFLIEMNGDEEIEISKLPVKLTIPKEYLFNPKKPIRLEIDMSNRANLQLISSIEDKNARLVFGKLLNNMSTNFNHCAGDFAKMNCRQETTKSDDAKEPTSSEEKVDNDELSKDVVPVSIVSQLNFFVGNIEKFLNQTSEFNKWWEVTKEFNSQFVKSN